MVKCSNDMQVWTGRGGGAYSEEGVGVELMRVGVDNMLHLTPSPAPRIWSSCLAAPTLLSIDRSLPSNDLSMCTRYTTRQPSTVSAPRPSAAAPIASSIFYLIREACYVPCHAPPTAYPCPPGFRPELTWRDIRDPCFLIAWIDSPTPTGTVPPSGHYALEAWHLKTPTRSSSLVSPQVPANVRHCL